MLICLLLWFSLKNLYNYLLHCLKILYKHSCVPLTLVISYVCLLHQQQLDIFDI